MPNRPVSHEKKITGSATVAKRGEGLGKDAPSAARQDGPRISADIIASITRKIKDKK